MVPIKNVKQIAVFAIVAAMAAVVGSTAWVDAQSAVPAISVPTYATPTALSLANVAYLATGAIAEIPTLGQWQYMSSCPAICDGTLTCVAAGGGDGGQGCWTRRDFRPVGNRRYLRQRTRACRNGYPVSDAAQACGHKLRIECTSTRRIRSAAMRATILSEPVSL